LNSIQATAGAVLRRGNVKHWSNREHEKDAVTTAHGADRASELSAARNFACAAFGGGGPLHAPAVAAQAAITGSDALLDADP
jgi:hypothetical protein